ncbi:MAG: hypothetical protein KDA25_12160 [Phycisphaerales bacterium]|nr:hypothetical protein [Phycisphaerales bacterium]
MTAVADFRDRLARPWRVAFVVYALAMTTGTHWPRLQLGTEDSPAPDKMIHYLAFAGLTVLLWGTRWVGLRSAVLIVMVWAAIDEVSQGIPALHRDISWADVTASELGIISAGLLGWAMRPVGGRANRLRLERHTFAFDVFMSRWTAWALLPVAAATLGLGLGVVIYVCIRPWPADDPIQTGLLKFVAVAIGAMVAMHFVMLAGMFREVDRHPARRPCFACGTSLADLPRTPDGRLACPACGETAHRFQWTLAPALPRGVHTRLAIVPAVVGLLLGLALGASYLVLPRLFDAATLSRHYYQLPLDLRFTFDVFLVVGIGAVVLRMYRSRLARLVDRQDVRCLACQHDLHATPAPDGTGRCGECGRTFTRLGDEAPAGA